MSIEYTRADEAGHQWTGHEGESRQQLFTLLTVPFPFSSCLRSIPRAKCVESSLPSPKVKRVWRTAATAGGEEAGKRKQEQQDQKQCVHQQPLLPQQTASLGREESAKKGESE